jgi:hypothetical protein
MLFPFSPEDENNAGPSKHRPNTYHPFGVLTSRIEESIRTMAREEEARMEEGSLDGLNGELDSSQA